MRPRASPGVHVLAFSRQTPPSSISSDTWPLQAFSTLFLACAPGRIRTCDPRLRGSPTRVASRHVLAAGCRPGGPPLMASVTRWDGTRAGRSHQFPSVSNTIWTPFGPRGSLRVRWFETKKPPFCGGFLRSGRLIQRPLPKRSSSDSYGKSYESGAQNCLCMSGLVAASSRERG